MLDTIHQYVFVADDLEAVCIERLLPLFVRFLRSVLPLPSAQLFVLLERFRVHPHSVVIDPSAVDALHIGFAEDALGVQTRRATYMIRTLLVDDPQESFQLLGDWRRSWRLVAPLAPNYDVRHLAEGEIFLDFLDHPAQLFLGGGIAVYHAVENGRGGRQCHVGGDGGHQFAR